MGKLSRFHLWNACLGNLFEHYDTALFGFLSPFLAPLIFPKEDPIVALMLTYAIIPLGMLARPLGSVVFGRIGDLYGRGKALFFTLGGMAIVSGCIALTPTYLQIGILSPFIFFLGRIFQNFLAAGETMGGAIFLLENTNAKRHDLLSSIYNASTMAGHLLASFGVVIISQYSLIDPGWRFLYLAGCLTALFGCILRKAQFHTPLSSPQPRPNMKTIFWENRKSLLLIAIVSGFASATYSMALIFMNGFIPLISSFTKAEIMKINTYLLVIDFCALPFFGFLASKIQREKLMLAASLGAAIFAIPLFMFLEGASLSLMIGIRLLFVLIGVSFFAPFHAWSQTIVHQNHRYAIISFGYALGTQLLGSPAASISLWLFHKTKMVSMACLYWMVLSLLSAIVISMTIRSKNIFPAKENRA